MPNITNRILSKELNESELNESELTEDQLRKLLLVEERRLVLRILAGQLIVFKLNELAVEVAAQKGENDIVDNETVEQMAILLHHIHLPMMADKGVLGYDPETRLIDPTKGSL